LKEVVADLTLENRLLKKSMNGMGRTRHEAAMRLPGGCAFKIAGLTMPFSTRIGKRSTSFKAQCVRFISQSVTSSSFWS
jgi:hypothetical protein